MYSSHPRWEVGKTLGHKNFAHCASVLTEYLGPLVIVASEENSTHQCGARLKYKGHFSCATLSMSQKTFYVPNIFHVPKHIQHGWLDR